MSEDRFPIMGKRIGTRMGYVPLAFMRRFDSRARKNHGGQSIDRLKERGGLSAQEAMAVVQDVPWEQRRWLEDDAAWANLQIIVSAEYPEFSFEVASDDER